MRRLKDAERTKSTFTFLFRVSSTLFTFKEERINPQALPLCILQIKSFLFLCSRELIIFKCGFSSLINFATYIKLKETNWLCWNEHYIETKQDPSHKIEKYNRNMYGVWRKVYGAIQTVGFYCLHKSLIASGKKN